MKQMKQLAKQKTPWIAVAKALGRTPAAVQQVASREGISLRAIRAKQTRSAPSRARA
jgi:hypothetical protein